MELALIGLTAVFASVLLAGYAVNDYVLEKRRVHRQLRTMEAYEIDPSQVRARELATSATSRIWIPAANRLAGVARRFTPVGVVDRIRQDLVYAGSPAAWDAERVLVVKLILSAGLLLLAFLLSLTGTLDAARVVAAFFLAGFMGWFAPDWILRSRARQRQDQIRRTLPDSLDLMSITVEAGLGFDAALQRVAREVKGALGEELFRVVQEMQLGKSRREALRGLGDRSNVAELKEFVLAMIQADIFGISVAQVLHVQAEEMRIKRRQQVEERAMKVPVKMIFPLIMCILPATFIVLTGPAMLRIYDFFTQQF